MKDEIFEAFFQELIEDDEFPNTVVEKLRDLYESSELTSRERVRSSLEADESDGED